MSEYSELSLIPLQCSQGGIPYNKEHLDAKDRRIAELEAENARLREYADHTLDCLRHKLTTDKEGCICGLSAVLKEDKR